MDRSGKFRGASHVRLWLVRWPCVCSLIGLIWRCGLPSCTQTIPRILLVGFSPGPCWVNCGGWTLNIGSFGKYSNKDHNKKRFELEKRFTHWVGARLRMLRLEIRLVPAIPSQNLDGFNDLVKKTWQYFCCVLIKYTLNSAETFTCEFDCIFLTNFAYEPALRWHLTKYMTLPLKCNQGIWTFSFRKTRHPNKVWIWAGSFFFFFVSCFYCTLRLFLFANR